MIDETFSVCLVRNRLAICDLVWNGKRRVCGCWLDHALFNFTSFHLGAALVAFLQHGVTGSGCITALGKDGL